MYAPIKNSCQILKNCRQEIKKNSNYQGGQASWHKQKNEYISSQMQGLVIDINIYVSKSIVVKTHNITWREYRIERKYINYMENIVHATLRRRY